MLHTTELLLCTFLLLVLMISTTTTTSATGGPCHENYYMCWNINKPALNHDRDMWTEVSTCRCGTIKLIGLDMRDTEPPSSKCTSMFYKCDYNDHHLVLNSFGCLCCRNDEPDAVCLNFAKEIPRNMKHPWKVGCERLRAQGICRRNDGVILGGGENSNNTGPPFLNASCFVKGCATCAEGNILACEKCADGYTLTATRSCSDLAMRLSAPICVVVTALVFFLLAMV